MWRIYLGDVVEWAKEWKGEPFHALFCDPPYNLESIKRRFGKSNSVPAQYGKDGVFSRTSRGFVGKEWDTDVAFHVETWEILYSILYPGSLGMAFSSTRTYHRMASAIDNAGFIIHPMIGWIQGQGFPKTTRIDTQIDRIAGVKREIIKRAKGVATSNTESLGEFQPEYNITNPSTDLAKTWEGYRYGLQALKPSFEPICIFQKPFEGRPIDCITKYGTGAFNIENTRIGDEEVTTNVLEQWSGLGQIQRPDYEPVIRNGRWPANVVISGDVDLWYSKFFYCAKANRSERDAGLEDFITWENVDLNLELKELKELLKDISGDMIQQQKELEWNMILFGKNLTEKYQMDFLFTIKTILKMIIELKTLNFSRSSNIKDFILDAIRIIEGNGLNLVESVEYLKKLQNTIKTETGFLLNVNLVLLKELLKIKEKGRIGRCPHPTVKPLELCRWLATLTLPPEEYKPRRLLVPFAGSGSEMIGALQAGWDEVHGIEIEKESCIIADKRLRHWIKDGKNGKT